MSGKIGGMLILVVFIGFATSCDFLSGLGRDTLESVVTWSSSGSPRSVSQVSRTGEPAVGNSVLSEYYSDYGRLIDTITPIRFEIPLHAVELSNSFGYVTPIPFHEYDEERKKWNMVSADFTSNVSTDPQNIHREDYTDFLLFFMPRNGRSSFTSTPGVYGFYTAEVIFELPDTYADTPLIHDVITTYQVDDEHWESLMVDGEYAYDTKILDAEKPMYQMTFEQLCPGKVMNGQIVREEVPHIFWFNGDEYMVYEAPEEGTHDLLDYKTTPGMGIVGNSMFTRIPWDGVAIDQDTEKVEFELIWDLQDIIQVYDNNTPENLSDDILVLADKFWERISVSVKQYDIDGNMIAHN